MHARKDEFPLKILITINNWTRCISFRNTTFSFETNAAFTLRPEFWQPGTKPDVCENGFPSFETQISCL